MEARLVLVFSIYNEVENLLAVTDTSEHSQKPLLKSLCHGTVTLNNDDDTSAT